MGLSIDYFHLYIFVTLFMTLYIDFVSNYSIIAVL